MAECETGGAGRGQMTKALKAQIKYWESTEELPKEEKWPGRPCCCVGTLEIEGVAKGLL